VADTNHHLIRFYTDLQNGLITESTVREHLSKAGEQLSAKGQSVYYDVRERFNAGHNPLDFLFLNRACFNGIVRFNRKGEFNVPFCRKPNRFAPAYVTKICNQVRNVRQLMQQSDWIFRTLNWQTTLNNASEGDFVYCDPPYIARHADYYGRWSDDEAVQLAQRVKDLPCGYAVSMWLENRFRRNSHVETDWGECTVRSYAHFYHVGSTERLRNEMFEALIVDPSSASSEAQIARLTAREAPASP
jgi:DNA adenine methylase